MKFKNLTLNLYINAWVDSPTPFISIHDNHNDELIVHFNSQQTSELIEQGEVTIEDLQCSSAETQIDVISTLLAYKSNIEIQEQVSDISHALKTRESKPQQLSISNTDVHKDNTHVFDFFHRMNLQLIS